MNNKIISIFGGSGFLGRYIVNALVKSGHMVNVISRHPNKALHLKTCGYVGQVTLTKANIKDESSIKRAIKGSDVVINLVGILYQNRKQKFSEIHSQGAKNIAKIAKSCGVKKLIHISALGVDRAKSSKYAQTKLEAEKLVLKAFPDATILRPSIIFGPEDNFFNMFAKMSCISPVMPLIGGGNTKFQPVYVCDVAKAVEKVINEDGHANNIYELGGPDIYSFRELLEFINETTERKSYFLSLPFPLAKAQASIMELFPKPILTRDQVNILKSDNIVNKKAIGFAELGISPKSVEIVVPSYLERYKKE